MSSHHKKPFSVKQKKKQLQDKRERKREDHARSTAKDSKRGCLGESESDDEDVTKINEQPVSGADMKKGYDPNRYRLHFVSEPRKEIDKRKKQASQPYTMLPENCSEMDIKSVYPEDKPLDIPKRPRWDYSLSRQVLDQREETYFRRYVNDLLSACKLDDLSYFELNLETWRQLWRVLEMSDIVLIICDIRFPALHFCPALYKHVVGELKKHVILVLNKIDLVEPPLVVAWKHYLKENFPEIHLVCFTSYPKDFSEVEEKRGIQTKKKRRRFNAVGTLDLFHVCEAIVEDKVDLSTWREKITEDASAGVFDDDVITEQGDVTTAPQTDYVDYQHYKDGVLTVGCLGYPNVGKSSLLNGLVGKKVVSISKTPGHTKHFQTIYLTPTVRLCDCPGLVFPSVVSRPIQILAGIFPVAQVREPYTSVEFLARRINLPVLLDLRHPEDEGEKHVERRRDLPWSAMDICYAWADKRGFTTAKIARPDAYRAANHLLRLSLDARLCVASTPPGYTDRKEEWKNHPDTELMTSLQAASFARGHEVAESGSDSEMAQHAWSEKEFSDDEEDSGGDEADEKSSSSKVIPTRNPFSLLGSDSDD